MQIIGIILLLVVSVAFPPIGFCLLALLALALIGEAM